MNEKIAWNQLVEYLGSLPATSDFPKKLTEYLHTKYADKDFVDVYIEGKVLKIGEKSVVLEDKGKIMEIFKAFLTSSEQTLSRATLVKAIYTGAYTKEISKRQLNCHNHNVVKLISRARKIAQSSYSNTAQCCDWFPYDPCSRSWRLYRVRDEIGENA